MAYAFFDYTGAFLRSGFAHVDNVIPVIKTITWLLLSRLQGNKPHRSPEPWVSGVTLRNLPEPSGTCLRNLHHFTPELSGTFRNVPPEPTPAHAGTLRNLPEPSSGTCSTDSRQHTPELIWAEDPISLRCSGKIHRHRPQTAANHVSTMFMRNKDSLVAPFLKNKRKKRRETSPGSRRNQKITMQHQPFS